MRSPMELVQMKKRIKKLSYSTLTFRGRNYKEEPGKGAEIKQPVRSK